MATAYVDSVVGAAGMAGNTAQLPGPVPVGPEVGLCGLSSGGQGGILYGYLADDR